MCSAQKSSCLHTLTITASWRWMLSHDSSICVISGFWFNNFFRHYFGNPSSKLLKRKKYLDSGDWFDAAMKKDCTASGMIEQDIVLSCSIAVDMNYVISKYLVVFLCAVSFSAGNRGGPGIPALWESSKGFVSQASPDDLKMDFRTDLCKMCVVETPQLTLIFDHHCPFHCSSFMLGRYLLLWLAPW